MCQSQEQGGKRCDQKSAASHARALLQSQKRYHDKKGHVEESLAIEAKLAKLDQARETYGDCVSPLEIDLTQDTHILINRLYDQGLSPMVVGGSVRDAFSGKPSKDIDIEVYGGTINKVSNTLKKRYRVDEVGKAFGVLKVVLPDGTDIDISLPRKDSKVGEGHTGFHVQTDEDLSIEEAASRRDYTFNAMMWSPSHAALVDPYGGEQDLKSKTLRHVSEAFAEDPLRVMRGFQFASRFDMTMDKDTVALSQRLLPEARNLADERIATEWEKFYLKGDTPSQGLSVLKQTGWDSIHPGLAEANTPQLSQQLNEIVSSEQSAFKTPDARIRILSATIMHHIDEKSHLDFTHQTIIGKKVGQGARVLANIKLDNPTDYDLRTRANIFASTGTSFEEWLAVERHQNAGNASQVSKRVTELGLMNHPNPSLLLGRDILTLTDRKPGKWLGNLVQKAQDAQYRNEFRNKEDAIKWVKHELSNSSD